MARPLWITQADEKFVSDACQGQFDRFDNDRELSQSNIAVVRCKPPSNPLFFKKSCVALLQVKSPRNPDSKWRVTQASFVNEHRFLEDAGTLGVLGRKGSCQFLLSVHRTDMTTGRRCSRSSHYCSQSERRSGCFLNRVPNLD